MLALNVAVESGLEASYATYMPGVYKIPMVRMYQVAVLTNFRMYGSRRMSHRNVVAAKGGVCGG